MLLWQYDETEFDKTSIKLQDESHYLFVAVKLLKSLREYICSVINNFNDIEKIILSLSNVVSKKYNTEKQKIKLFVS